MRGLFTHNIPWKIASVAVSFLLWLALAREPELSTTLQVPVQYKNVPDGLDISSDIPDRVHMEVRGPSGRLSRESLIEAAVLLDLSSVQGPGERTFTLTQRNSKLPMGVDFYRAVPSQIRLRFEKLLSRKVPVQARYSGPPPSGYRIVSQTLNPSQVTVRGPASRVVKVESVQTDAIDLSGIVSEMAFQVHVYVNDPQVRPEAASPVMYHVKMEKIMNGPGR